MLSWEFSDKEEADAKEKISESSLEECSKKLFLLIQTVVKEI